MRKPLIAGNWKMHGTVSIVKQLISDIKQGLNHYSAYPENFSNVGIDIAVLPAFVYLSQVEALLKTSSIQWGAQNLYIGKEGAFTGEISGEMLSDLKCKYVLVGHSERRAIFQEGLDLVAAKFKAAIHFGITPILCVGETQAEREAGDAEAIVSRQLSSVINTSGMNAFSQAVIAYEPVWAIGTGLTATPEQAQMMHAFIRRELMQNNVDIAKTIRILYGGSMKPENAGSLLSMPDIDGGLIGGASLNAASFLEIYTAAIKEKSVMHKLG